MRCLIIYYSRTGKTSLVAKTIKKQLKAHSKEIADYTNERSLLDYMFTSLMDSSSINPRKVEIDYYDTIFIGTPVWFGSLTPAIKKIIDTLDFKNKNVVLFNTMEYVGGDIAIRRMAKLVKKHNGNVIGAFTIMTNCSDSVIIENTLLALKDLKLT